MAPAMQAPPRECKPAAGFSPTYEDLSCQESLIRDHDQKLRFRHHIKEGVIRSSYQLDNAGIKFIYLRDPQTLGCQPLVSQLGYTFFFSFGSCAGAGMSEIRDF